MNIYIYPSKALHHVTMCVKVHGIDRSLFARLATVLARNTGYELESRHHLWDAASPIYPLVSSAPWLAGKSPK